MSDNQKHIVMFENWCAKCKDAKTPEIEEPCNTCMTQNYNDNSRIPVSYEGPRPNDK